MMLASFLRGSVMAEETLIKTHLIITDIHEEFEMKWQGRIIDTNPLLKNGIPIFVIISSGGRIELNTIDMKKIEDNAKLLTRPRGREAVTSDRAYIYIKEIDNKQTLVGTLLHKHVKTFAPMFDPVGYY